MFLFRSPEGVMKKLSPEEMQQYMGKWGVWFKKLMDAGIYEDGDRLSPSDAKTLTGKEKIITDGPYAESKEIIGGYVRIKAKDINEAAEIAKECPVLKLNGSVEIRGSFEE